MTLLIFGILWIVLGIAELAGWQGKVPQKFKGKPWTRQYLRLSGLTWLMLGIPWLILYALTVYLGLGVLVTVLLGIVLAAPSCVYSVMLDKRYTKMLGELIDENQPTAWE